MPDFGWGKGGNLDGQVGQAGGLTRLRQLSRSPLWQQSRLWLGRRLLALAGPMLRLSRISPNRSSSSPDPRKLLSRASSAHESRASSAHESRAFSGLSGGVLGEDGQFQIPAQDSQLFGDLGIIFPISPGLPLPALPSSLPLSLTFPEGTQKTSLPAGVSCWGAGAGSAKDRFGGVGPQELQSQGTV